MDTIDTAIMQELKENGRASASEISSRVNLSIPAVAQRIRKLESTGIIRQYTIRTDRQKTGKTILAFLLVCIDATKNIQPFRDSITKHSCVLECHHVTGAHDYLLKVTAEDMQTLEVFISKTVKTIPGVVGTNTMISLLTLKEEINA